MYGCVSKPYIYIYTFIHIYNAPLLIATAPSSPTSNDQKRSNLGCMEGWPAAAALVETKTEGFCAGHTGAATSPNLWQL